MQTLCKAGAGWVGRATLKENGVDLHEVTALMTQPRTRFTRLFFTTTLAVSAIGVAACDADDDLDEEARAAELEAPEGDHPRHADKAAHLLSKMDADQDGAVSAAEAEGHWLSHKFDELDQNGDASLDATELSAMKRRGRGRGHEHGKRGHGKRGHGKRDAMNELDTNEDGRISVDEAKGPMAEHFTDIDADEDGQLTKDELRGHHQQMRARRHEEHFADMDADRDGVISAAEAKGPMAEHFADIDGDGDGELTKDELKAAHDQMRGMKHGGEHHRRGKHGHNESDGDKSLDVAEAAD